jgi:lipopolysaccharide exporter
MRSPPAADKARTVGAPHLTTLTVWGLLWSYLSLIVTKTGGLITAVAAAWMLTPLQFGAVVYATVSVELLGVMKDLGLGAAIIRHKDEPAMLDTAFILSLLAGLAFTAITVAGAPYAAAWLGEPSVSGLLGVLGLFFICDAVGSVHAVLLRRQLEFKRKVAVDSARAFVKVVVAIGGLLLGFGPLALVASVVVGASVSSVVAWRMHPWRPRLHWHRGHARELSRYGGPLALADFIAQVQARIELLIVGGTFGAPALGLYTLAERAPTAANALLWTSSHVLFPAFARIGDDHPRLGAAVLDTIRFASLIHVPATLGLALVAEPLVLTLFGHRWIDAAAILRVLALAGLASALVYHCGDVLRVLGRTSTVVRLAAMDFVLFVMIAAIGAATLGPIGVAFARLFATIVTASARAMIVLRLLNLPAAALAATLRTSLLSGAVMAGTVLASSLAPVSQPLGRLGLMAALGAVGYVATLWLIDRRELAMLMHRAFVAGPPLSSSDAERAR